MERINEIVKGLTKQLADKNDTKKALKLLERQLKNLYDLFMSKGGGHVHEHDDDAMFTKKPLGGMSCASCEKDIINLHGKKADFLPWNKMPYRDPSERIARVGQGFSKMLSMINPEQISRYDQFRQTNPHHFHSNRHSQERLHPEEVEDSIGHPTHHDTMPKPVNKTMSNFYQAHPNSLQASKRPTSAQVIPRPKRHFTKTKK